MRSRHFLALGIWIASGMIRPAYADQMSLEGGLMSSGTFPYGSVESEDYVAFGIAARASYELSHWSIGVATRGQISLSAPIRFSTDGFQFSGDLARRFISIGAVGRYFLSSHPSGERVYVVGGFYGVQNDLVDASKSFDFTLNEGEESVFIRGYGISLGGGYRFRGGALFLELNYEYQRYDYAQVVGKQKRLNQVLVEAPIDGGIYAHSILLLVGISNIF